MRGTQYEIGTLGTTRIPFVLEASTSLCQLAPKSQLTVDVCLPGGTPLPPGRYYYDYDWYGGNLPTPPVTVQVVAAPH